MARQESVIKKLNRLVRSSVASEDRDVVVTEDRDVFEHAARMNQYRTVILEPHAPLTHRYQTGLTEIWEKAQKAGATGVKTARFRCEINPSGDITGSGKIMVGDVDIMLREPLKMTRLLYEAAATFGRVTGIRDVRLEVVGHPYAATNNRPTMIVSPFTKAVGRKDKRGAERMLPAGAHVFSTAGNIFTRASGLDKAPPIALIITPT